MESSTTGVIIPVYRATPALPHLLEETHRVLHGTAHRFYLVDDSADAQTHDYLVRHCLSTGAPTVCLRLAENVGQQSAVLCGFRAALSQCDTFVTLDDDGEHDPALVPQLLALLAPENTIVYAVAPPAKGFWRAGGSRARDVLFRLLLGAPRGVRVSSYRACTKDVATAVCAWEGRFFYWSAAALQLRPRPTVKNLVCPTRSRAYGKGGYTAGKLVRLYAGLLWHYGLQRAQTPARAPYRVESVTEGTQHL